MALQINIAGKFTKTARHASRILKFLICLSLLGVVRSATAFGGEYYVTTTGNDTTGDGSVENPWRTIAYAISAVSPSSLDPVTLHVGPGTYNINTNGEQYPLMMKSYLTLSGAGDAATILKPYPNLQRGILFDSVTHASVERCMITQGTALEDGASRGGGILIQNSFYITVRQCVVSINRASNPYGGAAIGGGIAVQSSDYTLITECTLASNRAEADGAGGGGIYVSGDHTVISRNEVKQNGVFNLSGGSDGGLSLYGANVFLIGNNIHHNSVGYAGGGCALSGGTLAARNTIDSNWASNGSGVIVYGQSAWALIGGSKGNGNNIYNNVSDLDTNAGRQLFEIGGALPINAEYNYFGDGVDPHNTQEVSGNFDVNPFMATPVVFDSMGIIAVPSPLEFDTVSVNSSTSMTVFLFNVLNSLTDSITIFFTQLNHNSTLLELSSSVIPPVEIDTLGVTIHPKAAGVYVDTLTLFTSAGALTVPIHAVVSGPLAVDDASPSGVPRLFSLSQNYPNPFNPRTAIRYALPERSSVRLQIFDLLGRNVAELVNGTEEPGEHTVIWDASGVPSGVYFCRVSAGKSSGTITLVVLK